MAKRTKKDAAETRLLILEQAAVLFEKNGYQAFAEFSGLFLAIIK